MIGVNGNVLEVSEDGDMSHDVFKRDSLIYNADKVISIAEYRDEILNTLKDSQTEITKEVLGLKLLKIWKIALMFFMQKVMNFIKKLFIS